VRCLPGAKPDLHESQRTADLLTVSEARADATVVGCRLYDLTSGWGGHPGCEVPLRPERVHPCYHTEIVHS
jgi:hypothetical protein